MGIGSCRSKLCIQSLGCDISSLECIFGGLGKFDCFLAIPSESVLESLFGRFNIFDLLNFVESFEEFDVVFEAFVADVGSDGIRLEKNL